MSKNRSVSFNLAMKEDVNAPNSSNVDNQNNANTSRDNLAYSQDNTNVLPDSEPTVPASIQGNTSASSNNRAYEPDDRQTRSIAYLVDEPPPNYQTPPPPYRSHFVNYNVLPPSYDSIMSPNSNGTPAQQHVVAYQTQYGQPVVQMRPVVVASSSGHVVITPGVAHDFSHPGEMPLTIKTLRSLTCLSIFACVVFFPLGVLALVFTFRAKRLFTEAVESGADTKVAKQEADKAARLIIAAIFAGLLTLVVLVTIIAG